MSETLDLGALGNFDFTPDWARENAGVKIGKIRPERGERELDRGERKPFGERKVFAKKPFGERKAFERKPRFEARPEPLSLEVKILPETRALGTIIRKLQGDTHAYKLKDLAYFFLDNPSSILLKITSKPQPAPAQPATVFHQCKVCGFASTKESEVIEHLLNVHLTDYYETKEVECEPPKGNFTCVAKCGLSGVLLGPPNIHEFNATVKEMIRTKYPEMSEEQYRAHLEMVRDAETIEAWRQGATKKTVFLPKGAGEGAAKLSRTEAEGEFRRTLLPSLLTMPKQLMITADVAMTSPVKPLQWAVRDAIEAERRQPYNICFALRGAFHHRKLHFFRANDARGQEFVTGVEYKEFDAAHAIAELAAASKFVSEHPCCDKSEFPATADFEKHLEWLVTTGHVVAFTNGVYSAVEKFPKYGPQWKKRPAKSEAKVEEATAVKTEVEAKEEVNHEAAAKLAE